MPPIEVAAHAPAFVVINACSGTGSVEAVQEAVQQAFSKVARQVFFRLVESPGDLTAVAAKAVRQAVEHEGVVVACGGDGTINAVAQHAMNAGCPMGVLPQGTFNYFSRTHGIPDDDLEQAVQVLLGRQAWPVQAGLVNDRIFLVSASLGLYPRLLEDREAYQQAVGRGRFTAWWAGMGTLLQQHRHLTLTVQRHGRPHSIQASTLFVGNNLLQLQQLGVPPGARLAHGELAGVMVKSLSRHRLLWLAVRGALGHLGGAEEIIGFPLRDMTVRPSWPLGRRHVKVATDGEVRSMVPPLRFRVAPKPLYLVCPPPASAAAP